MADNVTLNGVSVGGGKVMRTYDVGGFQIPVSALVFADGTDVSNSAPVPVAFASAQHVIVDSATLGVVSVSGTVAATQSGTWTVAQGTGGSSAWKVDGSSVTQPVSAASLPLPSGAASETTLSAINTKTPSLGQAVAGSSVPVVLPASQAAGALALQAQLPTALGQTTPSGSVSVVYARSSYYKSPTLPTTGQIIKASPGSALWMWIKNATGGTVYLQVHDRASGSPSNGDLPVWFSASVANGVANPSQNTGQANFGTPCENGICLIASSTQDTYTAIASNAVSYSLQYL